MSVLADDVGRHPSFSKPVLCGRQTLANSFSPTYVIHHFLHSLRKSPSKNGLLCFVASATTVVVFRCKCYDLS